MKSDEANVLIGKQGFVDGIEYRVIDVRRGGMGVVYLLTRGAQGAIEPPVYKTRLAAKTFNGSGDSEVRDVIKRELKHWLSLRHENILELLAIADFNFELAALMPMAAASVADRTTEKCSIAIRAAVHILREAAAGLSFAWTTKRLLHLDVKPENMLIVRDAGRVVVKVSDWGMSSIHTTGTQDAGRGGTPVYMAPERFFRDSIEACSWDIFSLGVSLVRFVSGQLPFEFRDEIPDQLVSGAYFPRAASLLTSAGLHTSARRAALFLIHPDPQQRIANYDDFEEALRVIARNPRFNFIGTRRQPWS